MKVERIFAVRFVIDDGQIKTEMHNSQVSSQEALGLLDMAKAQIIDSLRSNQKEIFKSKYKKAD